MHPPEQPGRRPAPRPGADRGTAAPASATEPLAEAFWDLSRTLRRRSRESVSHLGVTAAQAHAIGILHRHPAQRIGALSQRLRIAPRSGTELVDALQQRGLVERIPDPADRRATLVTLSSRGEELAEELRRARADWAQRFFDRLDEADRTELARLIAVLRSD